MPVYLHTANLIVLKQAVEETYSGGLNQFRLDYGLAGETLNQEDRLLFSITRMNIDEFDIDNMVKEGLAYDAISGTSTDFVLHGRLTGLFWEVPWLRSNEIFAWHTHERASAIEQALKISNMTMDQIAELKDSGVNLLRTII
jgi:hypothetical protein